ncbi:hypothetical protein RI543_000035 [Arxiozyma heterogenica]|uniref:MIF4G domain-containing protein n=1 Tax=Arxiozyma heterogenica TaxID=278026 RepID=A0AAN7WTI8_9SACH|nr:hypothetical protein RI543_000035 [Kazachstania heterogenica]
MSQEEVSPQVDTTMSTAEQTKKSFIEIVKARKAALEKKRLEQQQQGEQNKFDQKQDPPVQEEKKVLTFAEKLRLKKQQKAQQEAQAQSQSQNETEVKADDNATNVGESSVSNSTEEQNFQEEPKKEEEEESSEVNNATVPVESSTTVENQTNNEVKEEEEDLEGKMTVTKLLDRLNEVPPIEDIYLFKYPETFESPDPKYKKEHIKYTYGPAFLLQFKDNLNVVADSKWVQSTRSKIIIPPNMTRNNRSRGNGDSSKFSSRSNTNDFRSNSFRSNDSRASSKRKSRRDRDRDRDDRRSNRNASRRERSERKPKETEEPKKKEEEEPKVEVAPLVPSANRWVPKFRAKKAEKKLAPDGVTELLEKEEVERKMKSLLNKLTLEKFDPISTDILALANLSKWETDCDTLKTVIEQIFLKACDEPHWSSMYAQLCGKVVKDLNSEIVDEANPGITGPKLVLHFLVVRCHTEFEKGWTDKLLTNPDGTPLAPEMMSDEYYKMAAAKRRGLGLVRFIGYLYRLNLLTGKMMFECFRRLMKDLNNQPSEEVLESVVELLSTVGGKFENDSFNAGAATLEGSALLDSLFGLLQQIIEGDEVCNRVKFKLLDMVELRERNWESIKQDQGPKTIQQIHEEEELARALKQANSRSNSRRSNRNSSNRNSSRRDGPPPVIKDKDNFTTTRSYSQRSQRIQQKEPEPAPLHTSASTNMFSALMDDNNSDDE